MLFPVFMSIAFLVECGVRPDGFALPRQHSLDHYVDLIRLFGAPSGLCSSITESKHRHAVKEPWRRSNRYNPLEQILLTNQRLDKLAASRADFVARGMLEGNSVTPSGIPGSTWYTFYSMLWLLNQSQVTRELLSRRNVHSNTHGANNEDNHRANNEDNHHANNEEPICDTDVTASVTLAKTVGE